MINLPFPLRRHSARLLLLALTSGLFLLPSCRRSEIRTYLAPRDTSGPISYSVPSNWETLPPDGMNTAQFICHTPQGDVTINLTSMASMQGRDVLLVGMWRGAVGLPELSPEEGEKALSPVTIDGQQGRIFEVTGDRQGQPMTIVTAFVHRGEKSWFFKLQGPSAAVDSQKDIFRSFLTTIHF